MDNINQMKTFTRDFFQHSTKEHMRILNRKHVKLPLKSLQTWNRRTDVTEEKVNKLVHLNENYKEKKSKENSRL